MATFPVQSSSPRLSVYSDQSGAAPRGFAGTARIRTSTPASDDAVSVSLNARGPSSEAADIAYTRRQVAATRTPPAAVSDVAADQSAKPVTPSDQPIVVNGQFGSDGSLVLDSGLTGKYEEVGNDQIKFSIGGYEGIIDRRSGKGIARDANGGEFTFSYAEGKDGTFQATNLKAYERVNKPDAKQVAFQGTFDEKGFYINGTQGTYAQQANGNIAFEIGGFKGQVDTSGRGIAFDADGNIFEFQASYDGKNGFSITGLTGGS